MFSCCIPHSCGYASIARPYHRVRAGSRRDLVDGRTGLYSQSIVRTAGKEDVVSLPDPEQTQAKLINQDIQLPGLRGRLHVLPATISRHPAMVWKPCRESLSPYYPFHLFTSGGQQIYVRSDGMVFTELRDQEHGL